MDEKRNVFFINIWFLITATLFKKITSTFLVGIRVPSSYIFIFLFVLQTHKKKKKNTERWQGAKSDDVFGVKQKQTAEHYFLLLLHSFIHFQKNKTFFPFSFLRSRCMMWFVYLSHGPCLGEEIYVFLLYIIYVGKRYTYVFFFHIMWLFIDTSTII